MEVDRSLVGLPDFKSGGRLKKPSVGSIPMHFRQKYQGCGGRLVLTDAPLKVSFLK